MVYWSGNLASMVAIKVPIFSFCPLYERKILFWVSRLYQRIFQNFSFESRQKFTDFFFGPKNMLQVQEQWERQGAIKVKFRWVKISLVLMVQCTFHLCERVYQYTEKRIAKSTHFYSKESLWAGKNSFCAKVKDCSFESCVYIVPVEDVNPIKLYPPPAGSTMSELLWRCSLYSEYSEVWSVWDIG